MTAPSKPYDALTRSLLEARPGDWLALFGLGGGAPAKVVESELSTVTAEADKVIRVEAAEPWIVHVEVQSGYDRSLPRRLLRYNALLNVRHDLPVHSVAVLLFPDADGPALDGVYRRASPDGRCRVEFHDQVVRAWDLSVDELAAGLATFPLAALAVRSANELPALIDRMEAEFAREQPAFAPDAWAALGILIGTIVKDKARLKRLLTRVQAMEDSATYQLIVERGWLQEVRKLILKFGPDTLPPPPENVRRRIEAIEDLETLEQMLHRLGQANSWEELLAGAGGDGATGA